MHNIPILSLPLYWSNRNSGLRLNNWFFFNGSILGYPLHIGFHFLFLTFCLLMLLNLNKCIYHLLWCTSLDEVFSFLFLLHFIHVLDIFYFFTFQNSSSFGFQKLELVLNWLVIKRSSFIEINFLTFAFIYTGIIKLLLRGSHIWSTCDTSTISPHANFAGHKCYLSDLALWSNMLCWLYR